MPKRILPLIAVQIRTAKPLAKETKAEAFITLRQNLIRRHATGVDKAQLQGFKALVVKLCLAISVRLNKTKPDSPA